MIHALKHAAQFFRRLTLNFDNVQATLVFSFGETPVGNPSYN